MKLNIYKKRNNGFTLIELLAVIVVLAIIAFIGFGTVGNIISGAQEGADKETIRRYAKGVSLARYEALTKGQIVPERLPNEWIDENVKMADSGVKCDYVFANEVIELLGCTIKNSPTKYCYDGAEVYKCGNNGVIFQNLIINNPEGSSSLKVEPLDENRTSVVFLATLKKPLDSVSFTVEAYNGSSNDVKLSSIILTGIQATKTKNVTYTVTYADGGTLKEGDLLVAQQTKKLLVTVTYNGVNNMDSNDSKFNLGLTLIYVQKPQTFPDTIEIPYKPFQDKENVYLSTNPEAADETYLVEHSKPYMYQIKLGAESNEIYNYASKKNVSYADIPAGTVFTIYVDTGGHHIHAVKVGTFTKTANSSSCLITLASDATYYPITDTAVISGFNESEDYIYLTTLSDLGNEVYMDNELDSSSAGTGRRNYWYRTVINAATDMIYIYARGVMDYYTNTPISTGEVLTIYVKTGGANGHAVKVGTLTKTSLTTNYLITVADNATKYPISE